MKSHAIIPIFIPHIGCPNDCVFCNQKRITSKLEPATPHDVTSIVEKHLFTLTGRGIEDIEIAFYGGSFTGIPLEEQNAYLEVAAFYKRHGLVSKIHLSTRPDYINEAILDNLKSHNVDIIELGAQSFDDEVLALSGRGHDSFTIKTSAKLIKRYGFSLGIQLMVGLPGDTFEKAIHSANELVRTEPEIARLYPTVVIKDTELYEMYKRGVYTPLTLENAVCITKEMYKIISSADINIIRVGLKSSELILGDDPALVGTVHPSFRQLVEGEIAKESLESQLLVHAAELKLPLPSPEKKPANVEILSCIQIAFRCNEKYMSSMVGVSKQNKIYFESKYPLYRISYEIDNSLADNQYIVLK